MNEQQPNDPSATAAAQEAEIRRLEERLAAVVVFGAVSDVWARTQHDLSVAYANRIRGDRADNLERAIKGYEAALTIWTQQAAPHDWAMIQNNLANAYRTRIRGDRADNIERAIKTCEAALTIYTRKTAPHDWAMTQNSLAIAYADRIRGDRADNLERAIEGCEAALTVYSRDAAPHDWAMTQHNLAAAYADRIRGDRADNLERAIEGYEAALTVRTREAVPHDWAMTQHNLAIAYRTRIRGDRADNIERAIEGYEAALTVYTREAAPHDWAGTQNNLAIAYKDRIQGDATTNLTKARSCIANAVSVANSGIEFEALCTNLCATGRAFLHHRQLSTTSVQAAQHCFSGARRLFWERRDEFLTPSALKKALIAMTAVGPLSVAASHWLGKPAEGLSALEAGRAIGLREGLALDESALAALNKGDRSQILTARRRLGELHMEAQMWTEPAAFADGSRPDMMGMRAYSDIVADIETTRRELAAAREAVGLGSAEPLTAEDILNSLPPGTAALVPVATEFGSITYVIPAGTTVLDQRHALDEGPIIYETDLAEKTQAWLAAYNIVRERTRNRAAYDAILAASLDAGYVLDGILQWCWDNVIGPAIERLAELGMTPDNTEELIILPQGRWSLLPLHAAWRMVDGEKRAVLDDFAVSYIPSFHALKTARDRKSTIFAQNDDAASGRLLALINPEKSDPRNDLPGSEELEVPALRACFPDAKENPILVGDAASKARLLTECRDRSYLHLSCHGEFDWATPDQSGLKFASGEKLRVPEIAGLMKLDRCRWVMLSACESGIVDTKDIAEESYGQVAAFMMAGASAVTATLWAVDDTDTALFVEKVYEEHIQNGLSPAKATQKASLWLRDLSIPERDALTARLAPNPSSRRLTILSPIKPNQDQTVPAPSASEIALQKSALSWAPYTTWGV